jgi:uncharacterized protein with HEPN domain
MGNILRHEYHTVSDIVVWNAVHQEFPLLKMAVQAIAASQTK